MEKNTLDLSQYYTLGFSMLKIMLIVGVSGLIATALYNYFF